ncbi:hypothetical protein F5Y04DRAFT_248021 [Hypomontagnella monticulosa]|nr:hypothetical protein F5Y04DRAFT_248021 [Hypomontagnella monticulosa]
MSSQYNDNMAPKLDPTKGEGILAFLQRYQEYQINQETTHVLIKDLLMYAENVESWFREENSRLRQELGNMRLDIETVTRSRNEYQKLYRDTETRLGHIPDRNPYVLVLIDGDGLLFKESLIKQGVEGGRKAANELLNAVVEKYSYIAPTSIKVLVKVIANVRALSKTLKRINYVDSEAVLYEFIAGFNRAQAYFDFVDVGSMKERADAKMIDTMDFHVRNFNCKHLLLGVSHDPGYTQIVHDIVRTDDFRRRVTLIEGSPAVKEIAESGISITHFGHIFRHEKLPVEAQQDQRTSLIPSLSYAAAISQPTASPPPQITLPIALKRTATPVRPRKTPTPAWNPGPRGLDPPIQVNQAVFDRLKKRKDHEKLCNNHFLRGPCTKGDECMFDHNYNPTKEEKNVIAFFARLNPCTSGQDCEADNCIYGHHCPTVFNGVCTHPHCKFRVEDHPPGTKFKYPRISDKQSERSYNSDGNRRNSGSFA